VLDAADALFDARARFIERVCEKGWFVARVGFVRNDKSGAARPRSSMISLAGELPLSQMTARAECRRWTIKKFLLGNFFGTTTKTRILSHFRETLKRSGSADRPIEV
jgi:hypothetical protein